MEYLLSQCRVAILQKSRIRPDMIKAVYRGVEQQGKQNKKQTNKLILTTFFKNIESEGNESDNESCSGDDDDVENRPEDVSCELQQDVVNKPTSGKK